MKIDRKYILYICLLAIYLIFYNAFISWFNKNIVDEYLAQLTNVPRVDYTFYIISICFTFYFILLLKDRKHINIDLIILLIIICLNYLYYRCYANEYELLSTLHIKYIKYSDLFILITVGFTISWISGTFFKPLAPEYNDEPFLLDFPISSCEEDLLNRKDFAERIAFKIQSKLPSNTSGALAIGITGKWGSGKTSFTNMINEKINTKNRIVFKFNPWLSQSSDNIIEDFFSIMANELKVYDKKISTDLKEYSTALTNIDDNIFTKAVDSLNDLISEKASKQDYYENINKALLESRKQIIVFIDDLDRLDKKEVVSVLKLVRNTANFDNLVYLVCYDKQYVINSLKEFNKYGSKNFLEKIFQYEFELPTPRFTALLTKVKELLKKHLGNHIDAEIDLAVDYEGKSDAFTKFIIKTPRDIIRLVNLLVNDYSLIKAEVNFIDFYLLTLIKLKYPSVYSELTTHSRSFFRKKDNRTVLISLKEAKEDFRNLEIINFSNKMLEKDKADDPLLTILNLYLEASKDLSFFDKKIIEDIISVLLTAKPLDHNNNSVDILSFYDNKEQSARDPRSFAYWNAHENYFSLILLDSDFPVGEFLSGRLGDLEFFLKKLNEWKNLGFLPEIEARIDEINDFSNFEEWYNHIMILKFIIQHSGSYNLFHTKKNIDILNFPFINDNSKDWPQEKVELLNIIKRWFYDAELPYLIETIILSTLLKEKNEKYADNYLPLTKKDIYEILESYIESLYIEKYNLEKGILPTYFHAISNHSTDTNDEILDKYLQKFKQIFQHFFKSKMTSKDLDYFVSADGSYSIRDNDYMYGISYNNILFVFNSPEEFEEFLKNNNLEQNEYYHEFIALKEAFENRQDSQTKVIDYDLKYLNPRRWW